MLDSIKHFFDTRLSPPKQQGQERLLPEADLASAALLIEVMKSDHQLDDREAAEFLAVVRQCFNVSEQDLAQLKEMAESEARQATSLYQFTRLINDHYDYEQKCQLIENMWRMAFSDDRLDKYEEYLIRQIADLIYVSHSDFIKAKIKVRDEAE